jgi:ABC-type dipeptide/oligopeptide/nickel transport system ATPase subunit
LNPHILLLDEPTSALDASVQAEVLNLLEQVARDRNLTFVMVSHDLAVITHMCDRLAVMRNGEVVEQLQADDLVSGNIHADYTKNLMQASEGFWDKDMQKTKGTCRSPFSLHQSSDALRGMCRHPARAANRRQ